MAVENTDNLFELELDIFNNNEKEQLPISLFQEIEADLCDSSMHSSSAEDDQTDRPLDFIKNIVDNIRAEFEQFVENGEKKTILENSQQNLYNFIKRKSRQFKKNN